jgi:antitoxin VapB
MAIDASPSAHDVAKRHAIDYYSNYSRAVCKLLRLGIKAVNLINSRVVTYLHVVTSMPLNIRSKETEELASALAKLTGETKTEAVTQALRERIQRVRRVRAKRRLADELDEIALHCSTLPVLDRRGADEIMGYDENGLPR